MASISRFVLIVYVLGGWLLPATHFHAHDERGGCLHFVAGSSARKSETAGQHHSCDHSDPHWHPDGTDPGAGNESPEQLCEQYFAEAPPLRMCSGLCAVCSARTLASTTLKQTVTTFARDNTPSRVQLTEPTFPSYSVSREHLSRGPPWIA